MDRERFRNRFGACCLILTAVLVLGIIQWSFLPILIQNGPVMSRGVLEMSAGHSSKFAAPFKGFFGDALKPILPQSRVSVPRSAQTYFRWPEERISVRDDVFLSDRQLRAPPSV
jgi:hypothetical protein